MFFAEIVKNKVMTVQPGRRYFLGVPECVKPG